MKRIVITRAATRDIVAIWNYISRDDVDAADRIRDALQAEFAKLAQTPQIGHARPDVSNPSYRFWRVYSYMITYRVSARTLYISRVIHGRRDFRGIFKKRKRKQ